MKRFILALFFVLCLFTNAQAANYFVDGTTGDNGDDGTTMDLAWDTLEYALESGGLAAGDYVWVRRIHSEIPVSDITCAYDGTAASPIRVIGWPRPAIPDTTITQADFSNGSTVVDNVVGITPDREKHTGRYITAPDGEQYMITAVLWEAGVDGMAGGAEFTVGTAATNTTQTKYGKIYGFTDDLDTTGTIQYTRDSASAWVENDNITDSGGGDAEIDAGGETAVGFIIDREYAGSTVAGVNGKFQIEADEDWYDDMGTQFGFDDSGWTIKETNWDGDALDLPVINFNGGAVQILVNGNEYHSFRNLELRNSTDADGLFSWRSSKRVELRGCLLWNNNSAPVIAITGGYAHLSIRRSILEGAAGGGANGKGITLDAHGYLYLSDVAIFNTSSTGILTMYGTIVVATNVNIGVEIACNVDLTLGYTTHIVGRDVHLGGTNGYISRATAYSFEDVCIENYQKVLGNHYSFRSFGAVEKVAVTGETPNKKLSDDIIKITCDVDGQNVAIDDWAIPVFTHEFEATTDSKDYKYWIYNDTGDTLNNGNAKGNIWLECEYVSAYDDTSEYVITKAYSTEHTIADAADADDWDYLSVTGIQPAVASKVRIKCYISYYNADSADNIFIDPSVVIQWIFIGPWQIYLISIPGTFVRILIARRKRCAVY